MRGFNFWGFIRHMPQKAPLKFKTNLNKHFNWAGNL